MIILNEELFDSTNGINSLLIDAINKKWEMVETLNSMIVTFESEGNSDMTPVLTSILEDEHNHIGQLQQLVELISPESKEIETGKADAIETLDNPEIMSESLLRESASFEQDIYQWLDNWYATEGWKEKFKNYIERIKRSGYNTTNLTKDINIAIKKFCKGSSIKPQKIMSVLQESLQNQVNIDRNKSLLRGEAVSESLLEDIDENAPVYYVSYYEEAPAFHPEEGGYYVRTCELVDSEECATLDDARKRIEELAQEDGLMEKITDEFWVERSKYIGNDRFYIIETEQGSEEKGDEIYS